MQTGKLRGTLRARASLRATVAATGQLVGTLALPRVGYPDYTGAYIVTPEIDEQTLPTADKHTTRDILVEGIPYAEVANPAGGTTCIIGG